jgi:hypothetical protein
MQDSFMGLGIETKVAVSALQIVKVISGSPAERNGILAGDKIISVDGQSTANLSTDQAANLLQGRWGGHDRRDRGHSRTTGKATPHSTRSRQGRTVIGRPQFRLRTLFILTAIVALGCLIVPPIVSWEVPFPLILVGLTVAIVPLSALWIGTFYLVAKLLATGIFGGSPKRPREPGNRHICSSSETLPSD